MVIPADPPVRTAPARLVTLCGSLSLYPVSLGAAMHLAGYAALDLPFTYVPFAVTDLAGALAGMRALGIRGFGVSMPYKLDVLPLLDALDPVAARIGAANTIVNDEGRLTGHNTDWVGAVRALEEVTPLEGRRVLLLGAGGAARAIAFGLAEKRASVTIANRDVTKAQAIARDTGATAAGSAESGAAAGYDVIVNATSVGMRTSVAASEEGCPVPEASIREGHVVMDIVYKPIATRLVRAAEARGARAVHGGRMLLHQAARQFELYTRHDAPLDAMDRALRAQIGAAG